MLILDLEFMKNKVKKDWYVINDGKRIFEYG